MPNKDVIQLSKADETAKKIQLLYLKSIRDILNKIEVSDINYTKLFNLGDYPILNKLVNDAIAKLASEMTRVINNATKSQWNEAWEKNQGIASKYLKRGLLTEAQQKAHQSRNDKAYEAFQQRKLSGLKLSDRVWQYTNQFKGEIEMGIDDALKEGQSADTLSRKIRNNLQNPNDLFRRVRDKHGVLQLSKAMEKYHPSRGVYRSSYKNAMRLARTEVNMAYRASDHEQYKQFDFVLGYEIKRSNNIYSCGVCEELKGIYPKDFKFVGWHPQCRCYTVPILNPIEDFIEQQKAILAGEDYKPTKQITSLPPQFKKWFSENRGKIKSIRKSPYFVRDNLRFILKRVNLEETMAKAKESGPEVDWLARAIAKRFGGYTTEINYKSEASILRKVDGDYGGQFSKLGDGVRTTIIVPEERREELLAYMKETGYFSRIKMQNPEDYMGYSGTIANLRTRNGTMAEIQVNTDRMIFAKEKPIFAKSIIGEKRWNEIAEETGLQGGLGHDIYEQYRVLSYKIPSEYKRKLELEIESYKYYENFRGEWKTASLGVAPTVSSSLIESIGDLEKSLAKNGYGKDLIATIQEAADALGIEILNNHSSVGGWYSEDLDKTIKEASKRIQVKYKNQSQIEAFASLLGALAPEAQEGVYLAQYSETGKDFEHALVFNNNKNAETVINKLNFFGLGDGFSYDEVTKRLYIGDIGAQKQNEIEKLINFAKDYGLTEYQYERANITFPSNQTYAETLQQFKDSYVKDGKRKWNSFNSLYEEASKRLEFKVREKDLTKLQELIQEFEAIDWTEEVAKDDDGYILDGIHGTTQKFRAFDIEQANIENYFGQGIYFSTSIDDVMENYATLGADLRHRIGSLQEELTSQFYDLGLTSNDRTKLDKETYNKLRDFIVANFPKYDINRLMADYTLDNSELAERIATATFYGGEEIIIESFFDFKNPFRIGGEKENFLSYEYDEELGDYTGELVDFLNGMEKAIYEGDWQESPDFDELFTVIQESGAFDDGGINASDLIDLLQSEEATLQWAYTYSNKGIYQNAGNEIIRQALENAGFDGIIDSKVRGRFPFMRGLYEDTKHIIVFDTKSIKRKDWYWNDTYLPEMIEIAKKEKVDSFGYYFQNGKWSAEREELHEQIIDDYMNSVKGTKTGTSYFLGGATANGKSTLVDSGALPHPEGAIIVNSDEIKKMIPEYMTMLGMDDKQAAAFVHEESSYLAKKLIASIQENGYDFVLDGVNDGSIDKLMQKVRQYKKNGTRLRADYVTLDTDLSVFLAKKRAEKDGRHVPLNFVVDGNREIANLIPQVIDAKAFDELYLWDTNINGEKRLILKQINGRVIIEDRKLYERFLSKGGEKSNIMSKIWDDMKEKEQEIKDRTTELAVFYDKLGNYLDEKSGTSTHVEINQLPKDAYMLIHNHDNNSSFSRGDLGFLLSRSQLKVIRAIGPNGMTYEMRKMYDNNLLKWSETEFNYEWKKAEEYADAEVEQWIKDKYGLFWESIYWKENEKREKEAIEVLGRHSDRMNWWMANKSKFKDLFVYRKYRT